MNKFVRNLLTEWRKLGLPFAEATIVIAVSGGADSVSLALALYELRKRKKLNLNFVIAHLNHNLRGAESDADAEFVANLAKTLNFQYTQRDQNQKSQIKNQPGNLEQNARLARYEFLTEVAENVRADAVLTAHTKNDQAETLLMNLIRGSGLEGLSGIVAVQERKEFLLVRPLLNWAGRAETEKFCADISVEFRHDSMNDDRNFTRVKVRKEIIPIMAEINPGVVDTLARTAKLLRESLESVMGNVDQPGDILNQSELKNLSKPLLMLRLRAWLLTCRGSLRQVESVHFEAIAALLKSRKSGRFAQLPNRERVVKRDGKLLFEKTTVEKSRSDN